MSNFNEGLTIDQKILEWNGNAEALKKIKALEMAQRKEIVEELFLEPVIGTNHHELGGGYKLTFTNNYETKLDADAFALIQPEIEKLGDAAKAELGNVVVYKPSLVKKYYDTMTPEIKELFDEAITTKPSSPALKLVVPKVDK